MNYSLNFKYYNEQEKNQSEYVKNIILNSNVTKYKSEKCEFFKTHRYIFNILTDREKDILSLYYGEGNTGYSLIAKKYEISRERIRQILVSIFDKLNRPESIKMLTAFDDTDVGWNGSNGLDFAPENLNKTYNKLLNEKRNARFENLSDNQKRADALLRKILASNQNTFQLFSENATHIPDDIYYGTVEAVLRISKQDLKKIGNSAIINQIHMLGLHFFWEFEYEMDWVKACYHDMEVVGINDIEQQVRAMLQNSSFATLLNIAVDKLNLSIRSRNALTRNNINTLGDMVKLTAQDYKNMKTLGKTVFEEISAYLKSLGLDMRPADVEVDDWLQILSRNNYSKAERLLGTDSVVEAGVVQYKLKHKFAFDNLLDTQIEKLNLSVRSYNCLKRNGINAIRDIVILTKEELQNFRQLGVNSYEEINNKIISLNLTLRPKGVKVEDFLDSLERGFEVNIAKAQMPNKNAQSVDNNSINRIIVKMVQEAQNNLDINQVPEIYRKNYAMGAMANVQNQINSNKINRLFTKAISQSRKPIAKVTVSKNNQQDLSLHNIEDDEILNIIKTNPEYIKLLEDKFITIYINKLLNIVTTSKKNNIGEKLDLIQFIDNAKFRSL